MTSVLASLANGRQQFLDANGNPIVGGTVTTYIPGTLTLKTTYQDAEQTTPNANPLTLDALGSASIWGSGYYRQIVKNISGTLIWDSESYAPAMQFTSASAIPVSGTWTQGTIILNSSPTAGGKIGWVCTVSGTPGTWKAFGVIDA